MFLPVYGYITGSHNRLYRLLSTVKSIFERNGIPYSITGEALLSAVEQNKLKRSQSVATILVPQKDIGNLLNLNSAFVALGLGLSDLPDGGFKLSSAISLPFITDTAIQIYPVIPAGDRWMTTSNLIGYDEWYGANELFPTKMYKLGNVDLPGPQNPLPYLKRNFWNLGLGNSTLIGMPKKRLYNISPRYYKTTLPVTQIDEINGIDLDPRPFPSYSGRQTVLMGNGTVAVVPKVGNITPLKRKGLWRKYLWDA
ncbi:unnamed protein product [Sphagnum tenellum]